MRKILPLVLVALLALTACDLHVTIPVSTVEALITEDLVVPLPADAAQTTFLKLSFGAGTLKLAPGASTLVDGIVNYNVPDLKPLVTANGNSVVIEQGDYLLDGIPDLTNIRNEWDLQLGAVPLDLEIEGGAYKADYQLGGVPLINLTIQEGASKTTLSFSDPNPREMNLLRYETGASNVEINGLGNANFTAMEFSGGAGNYRLDFSGTLRRPASVFIKAGVSNVTLIIPEGVPAQVTVQGALANIVPGTGWTASGSVYSQEGSGEQFFIIVEIGAGNLTITH